ncbi:MAG: hypothetical protein RSC48_08985, partial [Anaerorhabdus sp.]
GGNVKIMLSQLNSVRIKRRKKNTFEWTTIREVPIVTVDDLNFITLDSFVPSGENFEWAIVPVIEKAEGNYLIGSLKTKFNGIFISDAETIFKLYSGVAYSNDSSNVSIGTVKPFGAKYPTVNMNGKTDYETLSIQGTLLGANFEKNRKLNRNEIVAQKEQFMKFMKNGKSKIIKDWNGNIWLVILTSALTFATNPSYGMGIPTVGFDVTEQGKYDNQRDLYENGLIEVIE